MPIPLPNLDDRTYSDLVAEAQGMIPVEYPAWTNHNASDPGIMIIELLAWLTEMALYQVNEITDTHIEAFLELLNGPDWSLNAAGEMDTAVTETIQALRERYRAVSTTDYEHLLTAVWPQTRTAEAIAAQGEISRICVLSQCNLESDTPIADAPAHVSLIILPVDGLEPQQSLLNAIFAFLEPRRLLTVILHVVKPTYVTVKIAGRIFLREDADLTKTLISAHNQLNNFFDPHHGGPEGTGWPFGRGVYASEIYALLSKVSLVDYIDDVVVTGADGEANDVGITLHKHQLVAIDLTELAVVDIYGNELKQADTGS